MLFIILFRAINFQENGFENDPDVYVAKNKTFSFEGKYSLLLTNFFWPFTIHFDNIAEYDTNNAGGLNPFSDDADSRYAASIMARWFLHTIYFRIKERNF